MSSNKFQNGNSLNDTKADKEKKLGQIKVKILLGQKPI